MNGPEFRNPMNVSNKPYLDAVGNQKKINERQQKIADLKAAIQAGTYKVDISRLANKIAHSGALNDE